MADIDIFNMSKENLLNFYSSIKRNQHADWWPDDFVSKVIWLNREQEGANFRFKYVRCDSDSGDNVQTSVLSIGLHLQADPASRPMFIKMPLTVRVRDNIGGYRAVETECLIYASAAGVGTGFPRPTWPSGNTIKITSINRQGHVSYVESQATYNQNPVTQWINADGTTISDWVYWKMSGDGTAGVTHRYWTPAQKADITAKIMQICPRITYGTPGNINVTTDYPYWETQYSSVFNGHGIERYPTEHIMTYDALPFPLFDYTQVEDIVRYINTGDRSGAIDPFDHTPRIEPITDYKTNFDMYISANNKSNNKYTIVAVNNEYNQNREELQGLYELKASTSIPFDVDTALNPSQAQVPTITFNKNVNSRDEVSFYFGDVGYTANYSGCFQVTLIKDPTSTVNVKINSVYWSDYPGDEGDTVRGYPITDGYEFTASSGERLRIFFRSISLDDIKDIVDENYPSKDDENNNRTGSDVIPLYGSGLRTYILSDGAFDQVNKALWNTDWSTVFKTTTIDPIKCVISCKRIPFTVSGTSSDTIYLANRDITASTAFISPVKKFRIGSYTIPAIYGNFVDITMTKIHVYLPYIGWKELPAPEVMSRVGRTQVGLQSKTYNLTFDYIVDFVDGNVRCIVSVNGTERWYFDGNCAIDVPVTSDNHTAAVSTAIKSGVATVMSVGSTIGGMWSGNALAVGAGMIGTIQNAMNVVPTYEYSATGSPSGYIDATMNKHIMLVIEYPNAFYPSGYSHKVGLPCMLNLSLGSCSGFTRTVNVDTRGINCTADESDMIKNLLNAGVYL